MPETVREVCRHLISDEYLQDFSYLGRRQGKYRFKDYDNVTKLIVHACSESLLEGKFVEDEKQRNEMFLEQCKSVETYFTSECIKHAKQRWDKQNNK